MTATRPDPRAVLDQLDELQAAATPGPWQQLDADPAYIIGQVANGGEEYLDVADTGIRSWSFDPDWRAAEADAALIVSAVNAAPALVAAVRAALDLADQWDTEHADWCCTRGCPGPGNALCSTGSPAIDLPGLAIPEGPKCCPGTCTCEVGRYRDALRAAVADALAVSRG